jgi:hypothetical protein
MIHFVGTVGGDLHIEDHSVPLAEYAFDPRAYGREVVGKTSVLDRYLDEIAQPIWGDFHCKLLALSL